MTTYSTGYGSSGFKHRLLFDGDSNNFSIWETRFTSYLYTQDEGVHTALLPKEEREDNAADFNKKNKQAYAELVQVLDKKYLQIVIRDAKDDGKKAFKILKDQYASTQKAKVLTLYEQL